MTTMANTLSATRRAALLAAQQGGTTLYRGGLELTYGVVPASTLRALAGHGLVDLVVLTVDHYRGKTLQLDHAVLTEAGHAARAALLATGEN
jgi:hypothetical protein